jgi:hypothetical protein
MALQKQHVTTPTYVVCLCMQKGNGMLCCWVSRGLDVTTPLYTHSTQIDPDLKKFDNLLHLSPKPQYGQHLFCRLFQSGNKSREGNNTLIILHMLVNDIKVGIFCLFITVNMTYSLWCYLQYNLYHDAIMLLENGVISIKLNVLFPEYECNAQG